MPLPRLSAVYPLLLACILLAASCRSGRSPSEPDTAFIPYVSAFTAGYISARDPIVVRLAEDQRWRDTTRVDIQDLILLEPAVAGTVSWEDASTLVFRPTERLEQDRTYTVKFKLGDLIEVPDGMDVFSFQVSTFRQQLDVQVSEMRPVSNTDLEWQRLVLTITTSDDATGQDLEACLKAEQRGRKLSLTWEHEPNGRYHRAVVDSVQRGESASQVMIAWNGSPIGCEDKGSLVFTVPALGELILLTASTTSDAEQYATLTFSDPLDETQELTGLAGFAGARDARVEIDGNRLILHTTERLRGDQVAFVSKALRNAQGRSLGGDLTIDLTFEELKPAIRTVGNGTILPSSDGLVLPFEAVNLNAVDVRIIRIHESNVGQFLQVNRLDGQRELARVGRLIAKHTVDLRTPDGPDLGRWNRFHLDLERYFKAEPGAIYRIVLDFDARHSVFPCAVPMDDGPVFERSWEQEQAAYDEYEDHWYYHDDHDDYWWDEEERERRNDPCSPAYYAARRSVSRNLLASDLGLIAKRGNDGSLFLAVNDLRTTAPISGVKLDVQDLQRRVMASVVTDGEGLATVPPTAHRPFLLVASKGPQRGYLKLDDGSSLSVSEFDVTGERIDRGLKGFIYGERGVWRPGDSLFLNFILQDASGRLPKDHPIVMELTDPRGRPDQKLVRTAGVNGVYAFHTRTSPDAPTGIWNARVTVGGTSFNKSLRIETVKPNRLKVQLDLDPEKAITGQGTPVALRASWLHGAPAKGMKTRVTVSTTRGTVPFKGYSDHVFDDLRTTLPQEEQVLFDGALDMRGDAAFPLRIEAGRNAPAVIQASIVTRVFETGGDASIDQVTVPFLPYPAYVGVKAPKTTNAWGTLETDTTYGIATVALDANGAPLEGRELIAQVYRLDRNWWWDGSTSGPSSYITSPSVELRHEMTLRTDANGRAQFNFRIDRPEWGRFAVRISDPISGHASAIQLYVDWPGWEGRSRREEADQAAMLRFNSDKEVYQVGDEVVLTIPSGGNGRALVSLETGSRVVDATWIDLKEKESRFAFTVTEDMVPNVYAHVSVVQPHAKTLNDLPIRLYGVIPIRVEDASTRVQPTIAIRSGSNGRAVKEVRTDEPFRVQVAEAQGRRMTYTLAIVDEGLLDLTRFRTPDPWKHFHAREALGVRTWDVYDLVIGAFARHMHRLLAIGGSDEPDRTGAARANRFKPVVRHVGPFVLEPGRKAEHSFTINNYVGSVRVMVVASDGQRAYGHADQALPVRKPLMVLATLPRVLAPGELADLPVTVFAMDKKVKDVEVKLEPNALLAVEGPAVKSVRFEDTGDQVVTFKVRVQEAVGVARVSVSARGAGEQASERIELQVRQPNLPVSEVTEAVLEPGGSWQGTPAPLGVMGSNSAYLEVSSIPPVDLGRRLQYLLGYPHGCLEQTTSKAFPQLYITRVMDLPERSAQEMRSNVQAGIRKMSGFQRTDGAFNYWSGGDHYDTWTSIYAGHFLVEAERMGHSVPASMRSNWLAFQRKAAREWSGRLTEGWDRKGTRTVQAYRLYVLALAGVPEQGAMNRLREQTDLELAARWLLAAAYARAGRADVARILVNTLETTIPPYTEQAQTYGSDLRDEALVAEALLAMGERGRAAGVVQRIAKRLSSNEWHSTQGTAFALMAVARFAETEQMGRPMRYVLTSKGRSDERTSTKALARHDLPAPDGRTGITVQNQGEGILHLRLVRRGTPMPGEERSTNGGLVMEVEYQLMDGSVIDPSSIEQGTDLKAVVRVRHPGTAGHYQQLALTQVFPSGWEIRNMRMEGGEQVLRGSPYTYRDQRDDRVMTYFDLVRGRTATYTVLLNAAYTGRYYLPGAHVEAMYDHTVNARTQGQWVVVTPPGGSMATR